MLVCFLNCCLVGSADHGVSLISGEYQLLGVQMVTAMVLNLPYIIKIMRANVAWLAQLVRASVSYQYDYPLR
jgi:hypothetical protein